MADLQALETWAAQCLQKLGPSGRRRLTVQIALDLRRANARRMNAQKDPDGQAWEGRKRTRKAAPVIRYLYKKRDGGIRELEMSSYARQSGRVTGYDKEARGIRTMLNTGILRKLTPLHASSTAARTRRAAKMMQGLSKSTNLKTQASTSAAVVEFADKVQRIAAVHHWGKRERVAPGGPEYDYPERALLGISGEDALRIRDTILRHLGV